MLQIVLNLPNSTSQETLPHVIASWHLVTAQVYAYLGPVISMLSTTRETVFSYSFAHMKAQVLTVACYPDCNPVTSSQMACPLCCTPA